MCFTAACLLYYRHRRCTMYHSYSARFKEIYVFLWNGPTSDYTNGFNVLIYDRAEYIQRLTLLK